MQNYLLLKHGGRYILGLVMCPDPSADPASAGHWDLNNLCIIAALHTQSSSEENKFLRGYTNAYLTWKALKSCHKQVRPIAQILLIQQALAVQYRHSEHLSTTSTQLGELIRCIYTIGIPKEEDFLTIMMLNAMAEDLPHVRNHIADALSASTSTTAYGPSNICSHLDIEQQLIDTEKSKTGDIAMAATGKGNNTQHRDRVSCDTCGNSSHPTKDCFAKGGAMEGKRDEVLARKHAAREGKSLSAGNKTTTSKPMVATGKPGSLRYDTNGQAYLLDSKTHQAIYITSSEPADTPAPSTEFAGLASDTITPAFIHDLSAADEDEYTTLIAAVDSLTTSLDWHTHSHPVNFAGITYKAPNQCSHTIMDPTIVPFFLDSGASIHISNDETDFFSLRPIPPRAVNGVGGLSIQAVGVGTLRLIVARGIHITLDNVLFIPPATVCLISVSALCAAHHCMASKDATNCWVQAQSGTCMLSGTLTSCCLYTLSGGQLSAEHAYLAHHLPTLQSWHWCLGHANYCTVYDLVHSGNATGMPINLSVVPPKCGTCILGKQTCPEGLHRKQGK
jgi:hypothetical protein